MVIADGGTISLGQKIGIAGTSGCLAAIVANPTDLVKVRIQASVEVRYSSTAQAFREVLQHEVSYAKEC